MKKYMPANLQTVKEFIQRMLDGERFYSEDYSEDDKVTFYFAGSTFRYIDKYNHVRSFHPCDVLTINLLQVEVPYTIQDALAEKPRLCWVWDEDRNIRQLFIVYSYEYDTNYPFRTEYARYKHAELATLEEIKQYLGD